MYEVRDTHVTILSFKNIGDIGIDLLVGSSRGRSGKPSLSEFEEDWAIGNNACKREKTCDWPTNKEQAIRGLHACEWQHSSNLVASGETPASISHLEVVWPCLTDFLILTNKQWVIRMAEDVQKAIHMHILRNKEQRRETSNVEARIEHKLSKNKIM